MLQRISLLSDNNLLNSRQPISMKPEIDTYRECVENLLNARSSKPISNGMSQHAAVIFEAFFKNAKKTVKIFCRNLNSEVFDNPNVIGAAVDALNRDVSIEIIVQETAQASEFISQLSAADQNSSGRLNIVDNTGLTSEAIGELEQNFAVMDADAYRYEPSKDVVNAMACMNDPKTVKKLTQIFNLLRVHIPREARPA